MSSHLLGLDVRPMRTPAFVIDLRQVTRDLALAREAIDAPHSRLFYAMKAFVFDAVMDHMASGLDGLHVSSLYEARLAREVASRAERPLQIHLTTPGLRADEVEELSEVCDLVSVNSIGHLERYGGRLAAGSSVGLRVNPQRSFARDKRYDPSRPHSKLGVPIERLAAICADDPGRLAEVEGLLVHNHCDSFDLTPLWTTVELLCERLGTFLGGLRWINLGGGYLFRSGQDRGPLRRALGRLAEYPELTVVFEPGASLIRRAGYLVSEVVDVFDSEGEAVAVLDSSVNHLPEVFEYDFKQPVWATSSEGGRRYLLAGSTCLAGDLFGAYSFEEELSPGSRVIFEGAGAYSLVKAHTFNGVALPSLYLMDAVGQMRLCHVASFSAWRQRYTAYPEEIERGEP